MLQLGIVLQLGINVSRIEILVYLPALSRCCASAGGRRRSAEGTDAVCGVDIAELFSRGASCPIGGLCAATHRMVLFLRTLLVGCRKMWMFVGEITTHGPPFRRCAAGVRGVRAFF